MLNITSFYNKNNKLPKNLLAKHFGTFCVRTRQRINNFGSRDSDFEIFISLSLLACFYFCCNCFLQMIRAI